MVCTNGGNLLQQKAVEIHETGGVGDFVKFYNETESRGFVFEVESEIRKVRKEEMRSAYNIYKGCFILHLLVCTNGGN